MSKRTSKIMVIDDDPEVRWVLQKTLTHEGFEVEAAAGGPDALERLEVSRPDVIVLDVMMPDMDGPTVIRRLRLNEATKKTPILMLTALSDDTTIEECFEAGVQSYMVKPFANDALTEEVKRLIARNEATRE